MKKNYIQNFKKGIIFLFLFIASFAGYSQSNVVITLNNAVNVSPTTMEFEVWIKNQGTSLEQLSGYAFGIQHSNALPTLKNGGTLTFSMVAGSRSPLLSSLDPNPSMSYLNNQFRLATINVSQSNAVTLQTGISYKLGRFRVKNTVPYAFNYDPQLKLTSIAPPGLLRCKASSFCNGASIISGLTVSYGLSVISSTPGFLLNPTTPLTLSLLENQPISCFGNNDASAEAVVTGDAPFTFNIDGGLFTNTTGLYSYHLCERCKWICRMLNNFFYRT
jgi:hypothetical protein